MSDKYAVVLAAGKGTRMKSKLYKVLHPICGKPMVQHVVDTVKKRMPQEIMVVVGHGAEQVQEQLGTDVSYVLQEEQLGTGHAVMSARKQLAHREGITLILYGDTPLITEETIEALVDAHQNNQAAVTMLTAIMDDPSGYGRIIRNTEDEVVKVVEQKDATAKEQQVQEINTGIYCFDNQKLWLAIDRLTNDNAQGEYYLTDCIEILVKQNQKVAAFCTDNAEETMGINDRVALAEVERLMKQRINRYHMYQGVTIMDPDQTYIGPDVVIGQDSTIYPGTILIGTTQIGEDCIIGPQTELRDVRVGDRTSIQYSLIIDSHIGNDTSVGPYAHLRPGTKIGDRCKVGDFVEIKNTTLQEGSKVPHLSYVGDADLGVGVNMGCGSITVNYDGQEKHRTIIEDHCFVGCNVNLIAPVTIGKGSYVAAGSTISDSVPEQSFAIARERQTTKKDYVQTLKKKQRKTQN